MRSLLKDHLDLARFAKRDDVSDEQFQFLVTATPQDVRDLVATEGYFTPVVRTDVKVVDDKKTVTVSVDPGPQTTVASVSLTFKGAVTTEDPKQENTARFAFSVQEGDPFSQDAWNDAKNAALKALQARRYLGAKITRSQARVNPRTHIADLSVTFDSGPTFTFGDLDVSGVRRYPAEAIIHNVNPIHPGDIYDIARVNELQRQSQNTPYYASVAIDADNDVTKPDNTPIHLKVSEYPYNSVRYGVGYATDTGPHIQGAYSYLDTFGKAYPFTISGRARPDAAVRPGATRDAAGRARLGQQRARLVHEHQRVGHAHLQRARRRAAFALDAEHRHDVFAHVLRRPPDAERAEPVECARAGAVLAVDTPQCRRSAVPAQRQPDPRGGGLRDQGRATEQTFARLYTNLLQYVPITKRDLFVFRAEFGGVFTSGPSNGIPASLLFRAGGANSVRGYSYLSIGNNVDGSILPTKYLVTGSSRVSALVHARLGRRGILRHRHRHRHLERARLPAGRRHRGALAQSGRTGERRPGVWFQEQEHQAVSDARHRLLIFLRKPRHA